MVRKYDLSTDNADLASLRQQVEGMRVGSDSAKVTITRQPLLGTRTKAIFTGVLAAVGLVIIGSILLMVFHHPRVPVKSVPNVVGMNVDDARTAITQAGLRAVEQVETDSKKPAGMVVAVSPTAGTKLQDGGTVTLKVAGKPTADTGSHATSGAVGPTAEPKPAPNQGNTDLPPPVITTGDERVTIPDVVEMTEAKAKRTLETAGIKVVETTDSKVDQINGIVLSCDPRPGTKIEKGALVHLVVNAVVAIPGPARKETITLKNYTGFKYADVQKDLLSLGLSPVAVQQATQLQPSGFVVNTEPTAGNEVQKGNVIKVVVSQ